jgi:hypothetical protein
MDVRVSQRRIQLSMHIVGDMEPVEFKLNGEYGVWKIEPDVSFRGVCGTQPKCGTQPSSEGKSDETVSTKPLHDARSRDKG